MSARQPVRKIRLSRTTSTCPQLFTVAILDIKLYIKYKTPCDYNTSNLHIMVVFYIYKCDMIKGIGMSWMSETLNSYVSHWFEFKELFLHVCISTARCCEQTGFGSKCHFLKLLKFILDYQIESFLLGKGILSCQKKLRKSDYPLPKNIPLVRYEYRHSDTTITT